MGLDMYIFRAQYPNLDEKSIYMYQDLDIYITEEEINWAMYDDLRPYCQKVMAVHEWYDTKAIAEKYGLGNDCYLSMCVPENSVFANGENTKITLSAAELKVMFTKREHTFVWTTKLDEIKYWRKAYDIQDWFYEHLPNVENCGFYLLDDELQEEFNAHFEDSEHFDFIAPNENSALFYHEWY